MSSSPIINSASLTGAKIDVAKVVDQLMELERQPLVKIDTKISESNVKISVLGQFQAKLSELKTAVDSLQNSGDFIAVAPYVSVPSALSVSVGSRASKGQHSIGISQLAEPEIWKVEGFVTAEQARDWFNNADQASVKSASDGSVLQKPDGTYALWLTSNGGDLDVSSPGTGLTATQVQAGQAALFSVDGYSYTRNSNSIDDIIDGVTLELTGLTAGDNDIDLKLVAAASSAAPKVQALVDALNELQSLYELETKADVDRGSRGILNSDFALTTIFRNVVNSMTKPLVGPNGSSVDGQSDLTLLGITITRSGRFEFNETLLAASNDVQSKLALGIQIGFDSSSGDNLSQRIDKMLAAGGLLFERLDQENLSRQSLLNKKTTLEDKLVDVELRLRTQYAALDALLFQLNSTSSALKSALDGLSQSNKSE